MNMVRIRHIMEMRRAGKAPPLLPPKLRRDTNDAERRGIKDILDIGATIQLPLEINSNHYRLQFFQSNEGAEGEWTMIAETEELRSQICYDIRHLFSVEYALERPQLIRVELFEDSGDGDLVFHSGENFTIGQISLGRHLINLKNDQQLTIAEIEITSQLRERPQPILLQFEAKPAALKPSGSVYFEAASIENPRKILYRSEFIKSGRWKPFTIQSDELEKKIDISCFSDDEKEGFIGRTYVSGENLKSIEAVLLYNNNVKNGRKPTFELRILKHSQLRVLSLLDYLRSGTCIKFGFAIDFSIREELTRQEHQQFGNDVEFVIRTISDAVSHLNQSNQYLAYGFGAKIPPQFRESNNFCLSLDVDAQCNGAETVLNAFHQCHEIVHPLASAKFAQIIYHISRSAQAQKDSTNVYYVLYIITRGAIEDLRETVQAAIFASKLPISICFVGIGVNGLEEIDRIGSGGRRLEFQGRKSERDNLQYINATKARLECDNYDDMIGTFLEKTVQQISWQLPTFYMQNHLLPSGDEQPSVDSSDIDNSTPKRRQRLSNQMRSMTIDSRFL